MNFKFRLWTLLPIVALSSIWSASRDQVVAPDTPLTLLISEVFINTPGVDEEEEWIELANISQDTVDLTGFKIGDEEQSGGGEGMARFPDGATIKPGQVIVIAQTAAGLAGLFGVPADYEIHDSDAAVPDMLPYLAWAEGQVGLANRGDELLLLDINDGLVDSVAFGDGLAVAGFSGPTVAGVFIGQSIERVPAGCDTDTASDWQPQHDPAPGTVDLSGECRTGIFEERTAVPIGTIQGDRDVSAAINREVTVRGVVTGVIEDQNSQGVRFYTFFIQDEPGTEDGDPATSDGLAVFHAIRQPPVTLGDIVWVTGQITEYFGLTEMDDTGLTIVLESSGNPLPPPVEINPPADNAAAAAYFEAYEGMRVSIEQANVIGPTFRGCSFAVAPAASGQQRVVRQSLDSPVGQNINVLHTTDVDCTGFPAVKVGDRVAGLTGPLTYHFEQFKIVHQEPESLVVTTAPEGDPPVVPGPVAGQFSVASFNVENYFDAVDDTGDDAEPKPSPAELAAKQAKMIAAIGSTLGCPTIVGLQEVENEALLLTLAEGLVEQCGFTYEVSHLESADGRGIDVALLSDPGQVTVTDIALRQSCSRLDTGVFDLKIDCPIGQEPLFSRPPLQVTAAIDGQPLIIFVNHFKSKSGGEAETADRRLAQAQHANSLVAEILNADPQAAVVVMGDFNDYELSEPTAALTEGGLLTSALAGIPLEERYSYIFSGASQLLDNIYVSPALTDKVAGATVVHLNADYPYTYAGDTSPARLTYRIGDHDIPYALLTLPPASMPGESQPPTAAPESQPTSSPTPPAASDTVEESPAVTWWFVGLVGLVGVAVVAAIVALLRRRT